MSEKPKPEEIKDFEELGAAWYEQNDNGDLSETSAASNGATHDKEPKVVTIGKHKLQEGTKLDLGSHGIYIFKKAMKPMSGAPTTYIFETPSGNTVSYNEQVVITNLDEHAIRTGVAKVTASPVPAKSRSTATPSDKRRTRRPRKGEPGHAGTAAPGQPEGQETEQQYNKRVRTDAMAIVDQALRNVGYTEEGLQGPAITATKEQHFLPGAIAQVEVATKRGGPPLDPTARAVVQKDINKIVKRNVGELTDEGDKDKPPGKRDRKKVKSKKTTDQPIINNPNTPTMNGDPTKPKKQKRKKRQEPRNESPYPYRRHHIRGGCCLGL